MSNYKQQLVSIVVPVYNAEKYLNRCIDSILTQTHTNLELILVNDGSIDNSGEICDEYAQKDNRVTVIHQKNAGVSTARNAGIEKAKGAYLTFVDSDDWVERNHIENLIPIDDEDCVYSGHKIYVNGKLKEERPLPSTIALKEDWINNYTAFMNKGLTLFFVTPCYKYSIIHNHNLRFNTELHVSEDGLFNLEYMKYCNKIRYSDKSTYCYEDGDATSTSLSHKFHPKRIYADKLKCIKTEELTQKKEMIVRWRHWKGVLRHYQKWIFFNNGINKKAAINGIKVTYRDPYFRECIPFVRQYGSLDEKIETFFMRRWLSPFFKPVYNLIILVSKIKNKLLRTHNGN